MGFSIRQALDDRIEVIGHDIGKFQPVVGDGFLKVLSRTEGLAHSTEGDDPDGWIAFAIVERPLDAQGHFLVKTVVHLGSIEGDPGNTVLLGK